MSRRISVVICTDGRAVALRNTLECLRFVDHPSFEVCVVHGPTPDGTDMVLRDFEGCVRVASNPERNLSVSRNIGIAMAAGEIVAFLDDDGLPEPEWLADVAIAFDDPVVGGAGGIVYDHTGVALQYRYSSTDRLARTDVTRETPADEYNFPFSYNVPGLLGTNSAFRKEALVGIGGFDEEYEYYLDETDVCCRLVDGGYHIRQLPRAVVHHKFLSSATRTERRVLRYRYAVLKNQIYYSLVNNHGHDSLDTIVRSAQDFINENARDVRWCIDNGYLEESDLTTFWIDVDRAWRVGLSRGLSGQRRLMTHQVLERYAGSYLEYPRPRPDGGRRVYCLVSAEYPPDAPGGLGRLVSQLARSVAAAGHHVHVFSRGTSHDRVDFEDGVWVHRLVPDANLHPPAGFHVPAHIWAHSATMARAAMAVNEKRAFSAACAPIWDCEGAALLLDENRNFPFCTLLVTMLKTWMECNPRWGLDPDWLRDFGDPMLALERLVVNRSDGVLAPTGAIVQKAAADYGINIDRERLAYVPLGLEDWSLLPSEAPEPLPEGAVRVLFVGRLEARKGIDVLLRAASTALGRHREVYLDLVGNDAIPGPDGPTWREAFESSPQWQALAGRVRFHGAVSEARLRGFYRSCDIFVAPSLFESFGLILLEAMMFSKAIIGCDAGGMAEVVENGDSGLLARPGDTASLEECLERLIASPQLRNRLGVRARERYEKFFQPERFARGYIQFFDAVAAKYSAPRVLA